MLFKRFYDDNLAQASYMIACERTLEAIVVDPNLDVAQYMRAAGAERLRITHVTETHIHADFVSGVRALANATGATLHLSREGGKEWGYLDGALAQAQPLTTGSDITVGMVRLRALHTPGHTPEHLTFLVSDLARGEEPVGALTGDFIFVGDVGRPDLLERAAGAQGNMASSAAHLFQSVQKFLKYPDHLQIWPGHGAGSACGRSLGSMPQSTLGYERLFNWALAEMNESEFVRRVLEDQPVPPRYFARMKRLNRNPGATSELRITPKLLGLADLERALADGSVVVDTRPVTRFATAHIPGTLNIPDNKSFLNWSGALVPEDSALYLIIDPDNEEGAQRAFFELSKIGLDNARGYFGAKILSEWKARHGTLDKIPDIDASGLENRRRKDRVVVVDVRGPDEWRRGHLPGAVHIPLAALPDRVGDIDRSTPLVMQCQSGGRSSIAASYLKAQGITHVSNLAGGFAGWSQEGFPVVTDSNATDVAASETA